MAFPTSSLTNNQVHKEGNRAFVYDSALGVWDQVKEISRSAGYMGGGSIFPTGLIIQTAHVMKTSTATISVASNAEGTIPNFELKITPKYTSSKILIFWTVHAVAAGSNPCMGTLNRSGHGSINIGDASSNRARVGADNSNDTTYTIGGMSHTEMDSPNTTSEVTYTLGIRHHSSITRVVNINFTLGDSDNAHHPRTTSSMTAMEIAQ